LLSSTAVLDHTASMISFFVTSSHGRAVKRRRISAARDPRGTGVHDPLLPARQSSRVGTLNRNSSKSTDRVDTRICHCSCQTNPRRFDKCYRICPFRFADGAIIASAGSNRPNTQVESLELRGHHPKPRAVDWCRDPRRGFISKNTVILPQFWLRPSGTRWRRWVPRRQRAPLWHAFRNFGNFRNYLIAASERSGQFAANRTLHRQTTITMRSLQPRPDCVQAHS
jgi:hypothetical protein